MNLKNYLVQHEIDVRINIDVLASSEEDAKQIALDRIKEDFTDPKDFIDLAECTWIQQKEPTLKGLIEVNV